MPASAYRLDRFGLSFTLLVLTAGAAPGQDVLIPFDASGWSYFKGTAEPSPDPITTAPTTAWTEPGFDDSAWLPATLGIGYGDGDDTTVLDDMQDAYTTVYLRRAFNVPDPGAFDNLVLAVEYDDGFVCYINGLEVSRANAGTAGTVLASTATAGGNHDIGAVEYFDISGGIDALSAGANTIAVQVLNTSLTSSDLSLNLRLAGDDPAADCPIAPICTSRLGEIEVAWTNVGTSDSISVTRNGVALPGSPFPGNTTRVIDASPTHYLHLYEITASLGGFSCPAISCVSAPPETVLIGPAEDWVFFRGTQAPSTPATAWRQPGFNDSTWEVGPTGIGYADGDDATELLDMQMIADDPDTPEDETQPGYASYYCRKAFNVSNLAAIETLILEVDYDDGFIAYLNGAEVARSASMGTAGQEFAFDALALAGHDVNGGEQFIIDADELVAGGNLLAVEIHNVTLMSTDASFIPRLFHRPPSLPEERPTDPVCTLEIEAGTAEISWTSNGLYSEVEILRDGVAMAGSPFPGDVTSVIDDDPGDFVNTYEITATTDAYTCATITCSTSLPEVELVRIGETWRYFRGIVAPSTPATAWRTETFSDAAWESGPTGIGYADGDDATVLDDMQMIADDPATPEDETQAGYLSYYCRRTFTVPDLTPVASLFLEIDYDDGFVAYLNGVEVARSASMGTAGQEFAFNQPTTALRESGTPERFVLAAAPLRAGSNLIAIEIHNGNVDSSDASCIPRLGYTTVTPGGGGSLFRRGDFNDDGTVNITDGISLLNFLFLGGVDTTCAETKDANDDALVNITDATFLFNFLFLGGSPLPQPGNQCGADDPASPQAGCALYTSC